MIQSFSRITGLRSTRPSSSAGRMNSASLPIDTQYSLPNDPAIAECIASTPYGNNSHLQIVWKNGGNVSIGKVPPEPATCMTSSTTAMALPMSPNDTVSV